MASGVFVSVDFNLPTRKTAVQHSSAEAPVCENCALQEPPFFNMDCYDCKLLLKAPQTTVSQIFAIMRQWTPKTQRNMNILIQEAMRRGANVNDIDSLTDMTMLHYCCKAGSKNIGNIEGTIRSIRMLLSKGASVEERDCWVDMTPLHYAALFNGPEAVAILAKEGSADIEATSKEYDDGTALHMASQVLCLDSIKVLLSLGANQYSKNCQGLTPIQCIPSSFEHIEADENKIKNIVEKIKEEFDKFEISTNSRIKHKMKVVPPEIIGKKPSPSLQKTKTRSPPKKDYSKSDTNALLLIGLSIGCRVLVNGNKTGILRYFNKTAFALGIWAGVELDEATGRNNGTVEGIEYFRCPDKHGLFTQPTKLKKEDAICLNSSLGLSSLMNTSDTKDLKKGDYGNTNLTRSSSAASVSTTESSALSPGLEKGSYVTFDGGKRGIVKFIGQTMFAPGHWVGIEMSSPQGDNDGSKDGTRYFKCKENHGVLVQASKVFKVDTMNPAGLRLARCYTMDKVRKPKHLSSSRPSSSNNETLQLILQVGSQVFYPALKESAIVRFIGQTEFNSGTWIGVEFTKPIGKNDGTINGKSYFSCKQDYGMMLLPQKLTLRGHNCSKLVLDS